MTEHVHARATTIVWGVILLLAAATAFAALMGLNGPVVIWVVVTLGVMLVLVGVIGAAVSAARRGREHPPIG
ncbi:MAG: hypothetical protein JWP85_2688 [Rhodoglobus sp.]|nr:hypothetical protein [Rhodoglobus sp.]